jgi:hypothetical protein
VLLRKRAQTRPKVNNESGIARGETSSTDVVLAIIVAFVVATFVWMFRQ